MITNVRIQYAEDIRAPNDILKLRSVLPIRTPISAVSFSVMSTDRHPSAEVALDALFGYVRTIEIGLHAYLLVGNTALQTPTRIVRHLRLWKALEKKGVTVPKSKVRAEYEVTYEGGVKYFGYMPVDGDPTSSVCDVMVDEKNAYLCFSKTESAITQSAQRGWLQATDLDPNLIEFLVSEDVLTGFYFGEFDDPETGFVLLGKAEKISKYVPV